MFQQTGEYSFNPSDFNQEILFDTNFLQFYFLYFYWLFFCNAVQCAFKDRSNFYLIIFSSFDLRPG